MHQLFTDAVVLPAALRAAQSASKVTQRFFAPQGRHVVQIGVKFGTEGPLLRAKFHPHRCIDKGMEPQK